MLRELLKSKGVNEEWLANKIGVSKVSVSNWVKGKTEPTLKNYRKLVNYLTCH